MRIAYILTSLGIGGAERQVIALAERMAARGHAVRMLVLLPRAAHQWPTHLDVQFLGIRKSPASVLAGAFHARHLLRSFKPNLIHSHNFHGNMLGRLLKLAWPSARIVSTIHNVFEGGRLRMFAYRLTDVFSTRTVAVCQAAADRFIELGAIPRAKCSVIANGIDVGQFTPSCERRARVRAGMGVLDEFVWMTAGRVVPAKDGSNLLYAFAQVHAALPTTRLWIAGDAQGDYAARMRALCSTLGLDQAVRWLGVRHDISALLDAADAFVLASAWEGMPLVVGEAMAMRKPLVATEVGGVREIVGDRGSLVPAADSAALAQSMQALMRLSPNERSALGDATRRRICERFSMETRADAWEALYRSVS